MGKKIKKKGLKKDSKEMGKMVKGRVDQRLVGEGRELFG